MERFSRDLLLMEKLAAGGMAEVYRAKHVGHGGFEKVVAVKRILPNYAANEEFKEMFRHEANLCAQFQHPNIVGVFSNGEHDGYLYLLMEFVNGKNLRQLLAKADKAKKRIPIEMSCFIVAEAARGLGYAHRFKDESTGEELNIVHRDMSPQNIMIGYDGNVKIVDFGIAKAAARSGTTRAGVLKGKFGYMSPEQAQGQQLDKRSDIFSLGIILWELLTQRRLFSTDDEMRTLQLVRECKIIKPSRKNPNVSYALDQIVLKALAKNRSERYDTAEEFYKDLVRYMAERHTDFIDSDFGDYMKKVFADNIVKEKDKRDRLNLEAPAMLAKPSSRNDEAEENDKTAVEASGDKTDVSFRAAEAQAPQPSQAKEHSLDVSEEERLENDIHDLTLSEIHSNVVNLDDEREFPDPLPNSVSEEHAPTLVKEAPSNEKVKKQKRKLFKVPASKPRARALMFAAVALLLIVMFKPSQESAELPANETAQTEQLAGPSEDAAIVDEPSSEVASVPSSEEKMEIDDGLSEESEGLAVQTPPEPNLEPEVLKEEGRDVAGLNPSPQVKPDLEKHLTGAVEFSSLPRATSIYVNGTLLVDEAGNPVRTPLKNYPLKQGRYNVRLENKAFGASWQGSIEVKADRLLKKDVILIESQ